MKHDEFIGQVAHRGRLSSRGAALTATRATLETLAERIPADEAADLAAQLPREIGRFLHQEVEKTERFGAIEFVQRMADRASLDLPDATYAVRAVFDVLNDAVSAGEIEDIRGALPDDYQRLFEAGVEGRL